MAMVGLAALANRNAVGRSMGKVLAGSASAVGGASLGAGKGGSAVGRRIEAALTTGGGGRSTANSVAGGCATAVPAAKRPTTRTRVASRIAIPSAQLAVAFPTRLPIPRYRLHLHAVANLQLPGQDDFLGPGQLADCTRSG